MSNQSKQRDFLLVQQAASKHIGAMDVLFKVAEAGRMDIVEDIRTLNMQDDTEKISPDAIVRVFKEVCKSSVEGFISLIDKQFKAAKRLRKEFSYDRDEYND